MELTTSYVHPGGIEPSSTVPKTATLSVELRVLVELQGYFIRKQAGFQEEDIISF
jgi:hypothetical protein